MLSYWKEKVLKAKKLAQSVMSEHKSPDDDYLDSHSLFDVTLSKKMPTNFEKVLPIGCFGVLEQQIIYVKTGEDPSATSHMLYNINTE